MLASIEKLGREAGREGPQTQLRLKGKTLCLMSACRVSARGTTRPILAAVPKAGKQTSAILGVRSEKILQSKPSWQR